MTKKEDITIMHSPVGMPGRAIRNPFLTEREQGNGKKSHTATSAYKKCEQSPPLPYCITTRPRPALADGDTDNALSFLDGKRMASRSHDHRAGADGGTGRGIPAGQQKIKI